MRVLVGDLARGGGHGEGCREGYQKGEERVKTLGTGECTFDGVGGFVLAPVAEDFVFDPGHVGCVVLIVLLFGPVGHDSDRFQRLLWMRVEEDGYKIR